MTQPTVETKSGPLAGVEEDGLAVFKGVPFARPPVGPLRFRPPQPAEPWTEVRQATEWGKWAPQPMPGRGAGIGGEDSGQDEDCLTLNVWTPAVDGGRRPVMVWIHGGGFTTGSGAGELYRGAHLAARGDVVVVTINYRLGVLGFAAHPALRDEASGSCGNWGLLDQIAALQWVQDNIAGFGGDPANVTIFGESAGGMSVSTLLGTPSAKGLFAKAIAQSGGPVAVPFDNGVTVTEDLMETLGHGRDDVARLRDVPVDAILGAQAVVAAQRVRLGGLPFLPVVDGTVVPDPPLTAIAAGLNADVPVLAGTNKDETRFFAIGDRNAFTLDEDHLYRRIEGSVGDALAGASIKAYRAAREERGESTKPSELWFAISTDHVFRIPTTRMVQAQSDHQPSTYTYLFTWPSPVFDGVLGACHALEIPFVFGNLDRAGMDVFAGSGPEAERLSQQMQDAWLTFARSGSPSSAELPDWPPYDPGRRATMIFDRTCRVEDAPMEPERAFWDGKV